MACLISFSSFYYFQKSLISLVAGDKETARDLIERALSDDSDQEWDGQQVFIMTLSSWLESDAGNTDLAIQRLALAERAVRRARINGVDDANIYYTECSIHALKGDPIAALSSLQTGL